jgi:hypothetical protein
MAEPSDWKQIIDNSKRSILVTIRNYTKYSLQRLQYSLDHGKWVSIPQGNPHTLHCSLSSPYPVFSHLFIIFPLDLKKVFPHIPKFNFSLLTEVQSMVARLSYLYNMTETHHS